MAREKSNITDGFSSLEGGMNSGVSPSLISSNQVSFSVNTTFRKGFMRTRPKFRQIKLDFQGETESQEWFNTHPITGWSYYLPSSGIPMLVCASGGRFYSFRINNGQSKVSEITPVSGRNSKNHATTWFCQASQYLVAQDGSSLPIIYDGASARRSSVINDEVPTGKQMAYVNYRLFVVLPDGRQVQAGDLAYVTPSSVLKFTETKASPSDGGGTLSIPLEDGPITALIPTAQLDTQAGQGILLASTNGAVCSFNPIVQRSQWPNIVLQNIALIGNGFTSHYPAIVNGDVWGRAPDGWRSFVMARREFGSWGNTPQSYEIERILEKDSKNLLDHASFVYFDNRVLGTVSPVALAPGVYHRGIVAIDFANIANLSGKTSPAYDGLWTGINPYGLVTGKFDGEERCFAFCYQDSLNNTLWEITKEYGDDDDLTRIPCLAESASFGFNTPKIHKQLNAGEIWVDQMRGQVDFDVKYRPDQFPCWFDWWSNSECAKDNNCDEQSLDPKRCVTITEFEDQYRPRLVLGQPPNATEPISKNSARAGYQFQFRIQWTGNCRIREGIFFSSPKEENPWTNGRSAQ